MVSNWMAGTSSQSPALELMERAAVDVPFAWGAPLTDAQRPDFERYLQRLQARSVDAD